jgi:hypothetical protein
LPDILDPPWIHTEQAGNDMLFQIGDDRKLATVQRRVADPVDSLIGKNLERDEIAAGAGDNHRGRFDFHGTTCAKRRKRRIMC